MKKIYAYIDESGQDTEGALFVVGVVIADEDRDTLIRLLEEIEQTSGKKRRKWANSNDVRRLAYMGLVLQKPVFKGRLYYASYEDTLDYFERTLDTTADSITLSTQDEPYKATVMVDGLRDSERQAFTKGLRSRGIRTDKVRGGDEQNECLLRLADALCGFVRDAVPGKTRIRKVLEKAVREGYITQVGGEK
jgi:hypothetical protein